MSVVRHKLQKVTGSEDANGPTYEAEYLVTVSSPHDHVKTILDGMPWNIGDVYEIGNDYDPDAVVLSADADPVPKNNSSWIYTVNFGRPESSEQTKNPIDEPAGIELIFAQGEKMIERDIHGKQIRNTAGDRFDDVLTREDSQPILRISRNEYASDFFYGVSLRDSVNRSAWLGSPRRTVKFQPPRKVSKIHPNPAIGRYYEAAYEFKFSDDTWRFILLNQGYNELGDNEAEDGKPNIVKIVDQNGEPITSPVALSKKSKVLKKDEKPYWLEFDGYRESQFPNFGLGNLL